MYLQSASLTPALLGSTAEKQTTSDGRKALVSASGGYGLALTLADVHCPAVSQWHYRLSFRQCHGQLCHLLG